MMPHALMRWLKWLFPGKHVSKKSQESEQVEDGDIDWAWFDYLRGPSYSAVDQRPSKEQKPEQPPLEMVEFEQGWPPSIPTD